MMSSLATQMGCPLGPVKVPDTPPTITFIRVRNRRRAPFQRVTRHCPAGHKRDADGRDVGTDDGVVYAAIV